MPLQETLHLDLQKLINLVKEPQYSDLVLILP